MKLTGLILLLSSVLIVGCSAYASPDEEDTIILTPVMVVSTATPNPALAEATPEVEQIEIEDITRDDAPSSQPIAVAQQPISQTNTTTNTINNTVRSACTVRADLPVYTVVAGDTLFSIASRAEMIVDEIVRLNCLSDRNVIDVGQQLRLTNAISVALGGGQANTTTHNTATNTATTLYDVIEGTVVVSPWHAQNGNTYVIDNSSELTVRWTGMPTDVGISQVEFTYVDDRALNSPVSIGTDSDMSNGAQVQWMPPADVQGRILAGARIRGQLHHTARAQVAYISVVTPSEATEVGTIVISPWQMNTGNSYTVNTSMTLDVRWWGVPIDRNIGQVEFVYEPADGTGLTSIGFDDDLSDGARIDWTAPTIVAGTVYAMARLPGQTHAMVTSEVSTIETDNTPLVVGPRGALSVDPNLQAGTPSDWGDYIVEAGTTVTVRWTGVDPPEYNTLSSAMLYYYPDGNGRGQTIQQDTNRADGFSFTWTVPNTASGYFEVHGIVGDTARYIYSPQIHVRTP